MKRFLPLCLICGLLALLFAACPGSGPAVRNDENSAVSRDIPAGFPHNEEPGALIESVYRAAEDLSAVLPEGAIIAVISINSASSLETDEGDFAEEQLIFCLVQAGKFRVVERRDLDAIRREQNFHLSGEVDDATAVSIGRMAGAGIVITGTILPYGGGKFLNIRALDVETAQIKAASSRPFTSLF